MEEDCARLQIFVEKELQTRLDRAPYELEFPTLPNDSSSQNSPLTTASPPSSQQSSLAEEASYDALSDVSIPSSAHAMVRDSFFVRSDALTLYPSIEGWCSINVAKPHVLKRCHLCPVIKSIPERGVRKQGGRHKPPSVR